ncbi:MAG: hypothetical protein N0C81_02485 [Candidatus Thiodiazotropha lotti]|uniref:Uncharacterized protein n=1 Tax=Candidatus Thiodiazotropha lotti TaxID=2792787 RepID=A0A9E4K5K5_9GAMM|nr:hypothetical protein [Candidatus Thiodiazotropha lotti]ODC01665.1 hypothetical protein A3197_04165 [Candidatus Thiodiazotropha endoloripes]MCG7921238.1 hypothetical protein [Candidatus Thiodiazotropha lotti]MCG7930205.1 hypothetical protein [Candidatus Thiodiazotropha lotti]MCG7939865.1 hypothetical protein [Candidatus Thiodiazotropha lotti]
MQFMDAKAMFFSQNWEDAARSSLKKHRFRTHTKLELEAFESKFGKGAGLLTRSLLLIRGSR